jgi:hypothetical protein
LGFGFGIWDAHKHHLVGSSLTCLDFGNDFLKGDKLNLLIAFLFYDHQI